MSRIFLLLVGIAIGAIAMKFVEDRRFETPAPAVAPSGDDDEDDAPVAGAERAADAMRVTLTTAEVALAGIETGGLATARATPESTAAGRVANAAELLTLLGDLRAARKTAAASREVVSALAARVARLRKLAAAGELAVARERAALEVEYRRELETAARREARVEQLATALRAGWGASVAALVQAQSDAIAAVERGEALLVEFASDGEPPATVRVAASDARRDAVSARVIGPAAAALGGARGTSWLAVAPAGALRAGMAVTVWIPRAASALDGAVLPAAAVVWHRGAQWYYVADDATHFSRHALGDAVAYGHDYLLPAARAPQRPVVLHGAQLLLAEEFRAAIPEEDDD
ncbi:MAG TPA: hypothetical protein PJ986_04380 [Gammaproteobacteria bacterium]|nr:hypothetical protein [Gammaproteobacteria bacterium]